MSTVISSPSLRDGEGTHTKCGGGVRELASETTASANRHDNAHTPPPACGWVPSPRFARGGTSTWRRNLARLPFLLIAALGLMLLAQGAWIPAKAALAQILLNRAFAQSLATHQPIRAWPWADAVPIARIRVPRLGVSEIVLSGGSGEAMAFGPTLLPGSGRVGSRGTAVFAAHRDTHFAFLKDLRPGDVIDVEETNGRTFRFRAETGRVVRFDRFGVDRHATRSRIVLTTCWPIGATERGPWRYVVGARISV